MRILLYGLQSSGASAIALTLAQKPDSVAFVDIWNNFAAPEIETDLDVVAKVVVTTAYPIDVHRRRFKPDVTVLVMRDPVSTFNSLSTKPYVHQSGLLNEKFTLLEDLLAQKYLFDQVIYYEDFVVAPGSLIEQFSAIGWRLGYEALLHARKLEEMRRFNDDTCRLVAARLNYGIGNCKPGGLHRGALSFPAAVRRTAHLRRICPTLIAHYAMMRDKRGAAWHVPEPPVLSCALDTVFDGLVRPGALPTKVSKAGYGVRLINGIKHCSFQAGRIELCPGPQGETCLQVSGLPGQPFNRVTGMVYTPDPRAAGTWARVRVDDEHGVCIAQQDILLRHGSMSNLDLRFAPRSGPLTINMIVQLEEGSKNPDHNQVSFERMRLDQTF